jgi:ubiquinone/menaquinone biosynthesis C-methylase UbiE
MQPRAIAEHDAQAQDFDAFYRTMQQDYRRSSFAYGRKKVEEVLHQTLMELPAGGQVLDIGCGTGAQLRYCLEHGFGATGLEPAAAMRAIARRNNPHIPIMDGVATDLPFPDGRFDLALAIEVFRYLGREDIQQAYREMIRVVKPGGRLFFTMVNRYALDGF